MNDNVNSWPSPTRIGADAFQIVKGAMSLARKVIHELVDDLDGDEAIDTVRFSYRGADYEVDLSAKNAAALDNALAPYVQAARRVSRTRTARATAATSTTARSRAGAPNPKDVRSWARREGIAVSDRGRMSAEVARRYQEAHGG